MKIMVAGSGTGKGLAINNKTKQWRDSLAVELTAKGTKYYKDDDLN
jgi:hypothetical protein